MRIRRVAFALLWFTIFALATTVSAQTNPVPWISGGKEVYLVRKADNFLILYDRSGSMAEKYNGTVMTKLQAERKILLEKNATLPDMNWQAGIYSFTPGSKSFDNLVEYHPVQQYEKKWFSWRLIKMPLEPEGATLLQQGLMALDGVLAPMRGKTVIFLFTDGQYTPVSAFQDPGAIARNLAAKYDICFVVINTGADTMEEAATINSLATATPCSYKIPFEDLRGNPEWMTNALFEVVDTRPAGEAITGYVFANILFDFDKYTVKQEYSQALADAGAYLREHPEARIVLNGHTDNIGTQGYNSKLSHRRADSVRKYLVSQEGVAAERITLSGFGFSKPAASNDTAEGRSMNRRVEGIITGIK